jgi:ribosome-associated translation inhibitor RaiA
MTERLDPPIEVVRKGEVDDAAVDYALKRLAAVMDLVSEPILFVRVRLTRDRRARRPRPSLAQATFDLNGDMVRAQVASDTMTESIDLLADRIRDQLQHRAERRRARRAKGWVVQKGEWRHGDLRDRRPLFDDSQPEEREIVHRKSFSIGPATPDEAAADMEMLDHDFWLFHDLASDAEAVIAHLPDGRYRLQRARPVSAEAGPSAIDLALADHRPPTLSVDEARRRLELNGERFVFFIDAKSERGNVLYRRYDGDYGVLSPA